MIVGRGFLKGSHGSDGEDAKAMKDMFGSTERHGSPVGKMKGRRVVKGKSVGLDECTAPR